MAVTSKDLSPRMSRRLANYKIKDAVIGKLADRVLIEGWDIWKWDVCIYGICIDYHTSKIPKLDGVFSKTDVARLEVFPYGIIDWDHFRIRVGYQVDELPGSAGGHGFGF